MAQDAPVRPGLSPVAGKPLHAAFDGGRLTSDGGVLVLAEIDRRLGRSERSARRLTDPRAPERVHHTPAEMIRFRTPLIAAGYPDANDCAALRAEIRSSRWLLAAGRRAAPTCARSRPRAGWRTCRAPRRSSG